MADLRGRAYPETVRYQPFYCEENVWHLCQDERVAATRNFAIFISNVGRAFPMHAQRAAATPGEAVVWDYHAVLLAGRDIWDLDCRLGAPLSLDAWLAASFPVQPPLTAPRFRVVAAALFVGRFASDRSHMRDASGAWRHPPPSWPAIGDGSTNLKQFVDMEQTFHGDVVDADGLRRFTG